MERIQICYDVLVGSMDTEYGLITYLFSNKVLSLLEMESIAAENTRHGKNEKLLNLLYRKDAQSFEKFVCGLSESNQDHLAKRLREPIQRWSAHCVKRNVSHEWLSVSVRSVTGDHPAAPESRILGGRQSREFRSTCVYMYTRVNRRFYICKIRSKCPKLSV